MLGPLGDGFVYHKAISSASEVLQLETRTTSRKGRCISLGLVISKRNHAHPLVSDIKMPEESQGPTSNDCTSHSTLSLDITTLVSNSSQNVGGPPKMPPTSTRSSDGNSQCRSTTDTIPTRTNRLACFRRSLSDKGLPNEVEELLSASWRKGTHKNYDSAWRKWEQWCLNNHVSPISASIKDILSFLATQFHSGHSYRSLNVYRSTISFVHPKIDGYSIGSHPLVCRLLKGVFNKRPPLPKYQMTWSAEVVITYLKSLGPNSSLSLKLLTHKLTVLLVLTTGSKSSDLSLLSVEGCTFVTEGVRCHFSGLAKQARPNHMKPAIEIAKFPDTLVCPVACLTRYLEETRKFRTQTSSGVQPSQLLIGICKRLSPVQACTLHDG